MAVYKAAALLEVAAVVVVQYFHGVVGKRWRKGNYNSPGPHGITCREGKPTAPARRTDVAHTM